MVMCDWKQTKCDKLRAEERRDKNRHETSSLVVEESAPNLIPSHQHFAWNASEL